MITIFNAKYLPDNAFSIHYYNSDKFPHRDEIIPFLRARLSSEVDGQVVSISEVQENDYNTFIKAL